MINSYCVLQTQMQTLCYLISVLRLCTISHTDHTVFLSTCTTRSKHSNSSGFVCMHMCVNVTVWGCVRGKRKLRDEVKSLWHCSSAEHPPRKTGRTRAPESENEIMKGRRGGEHQEGRPRIARRNYWRWQLIVILILHFSSVRKLDIFWYSSGLFVSLKRATLLTCWTDKESDWFGLRLI